VFPCWPFGWWVAVVLDHFSRRVQGFEVFDRRPDSQSIISLLDRIILQGGAKPKYLISDQEAQFVSDEMHEWCRPKGITQRFGAIGEHGSIAVLERLIQTMKVECTRLILIPFGCSSDSPLTPPKRPICIRQPEAARLDANDRFEARTGASRSLGGRVLASSFLIV